jgi:hypothetical protein
MTSNDHTGCDAEVFPDPATGKVISRFFNPETGEMVVELHLAPEVSREYAFNLTRASLALEE